MYKLLIIDDEPLVQAGIRSMVPWNELDIEVCGVANNGKAGLDIIDAEHPDIVITDIKMPVMTGLELLKTVREKYGNLHPAFIILTSYEDFCLAKEAISYTIIDYLVKIELTPEALKKAVKRAVHILSESAVETQQNTLSQTDIQSLKDKFFIRLLHNLYDSETQFDLLRKDLDIPISYAAYQCCYFEMVNDKAEQLSVDQQVTLYANSFHLLQEITGKYRNAYYVTLDRKHGVIIFLYDTLQEIDSWEKISLILQQTSDSLHSYYNTSLKAGIGSIVHTPLAIADSYSNARHAYGNASSSQSILAFENVDGITDAHAVFNMAFFKADLSTAFSEYDSAILTNVIAQITALFQEHPAHYLQALDAACNILFLALSLIPDGEAVLTEIFQDKPDGYRSIYNQKTTSQIVAWLHTFSERLCGIFDAHKKEHRHHIVENVKKYIETHLQDRLNLNEVSAIYGISPNYLSSLFKKYNDCGYSEYITYRKVEEAKKMMTQSNKKIYEIANALGFESAFYFSKVFKKVEGISPTEYINK